MHLTPCQSPVGTCSNYPCENKNATLNKHCTCSYWIAIPIWQTDETVSKIASYKFDPRVTTYCTCKNMDYVWDIACYAQCRDAQSWAVPCDHPCRRHDPSSCTRRHRPANKDIHHVNQGSIDQTSVISGIVTSDTSMTSYTSKYISMILSLCDLFDVDVTAMTTVSWHASIHRCWLT